MPIPPYEGRSVEEKCALSGSEAFGIVRREGGRETEEVTITNFKSGYLKPNSSDV
jgi:hypothetical protein